MSTVPNFRALESAAKSGITLEDFAAKYEYTPDEMKEYIKSFLQSPSDRRRILHAFRQNAKRAQDRHNQPHSDVDSLTQGTSRSVYVPPTPQEQRIAALAAQEKQQDQAIRALLHNRDTVFSQLNAKTNELQRLARKIDETIAELGKYQAQFIDTRTAIEEFDQELATLDSEINDAKAQHDSTVEEYTRLTTIEVYVYEDGNIESSSDKLSFKISSHDDVLAIQERLSSSDIIKAMKDEGVDWDNLSRDQQWSVIHVIYCICRSKSSSLTEDVYVIFEDEQLAKLSGIYSPHELK